METREIAKCHISGTASGPLRIREVFASVRFLSDEGPYPSKWDAIAVLKSDYTIEVGICRDSSLQNWAAYDITDGDESFVGVFDSIPAAVGKWAYMNQPVRGWFAYMKP